MILYLDTNEHFNSNSVCTCACVRVCVCVVLRCPYVALADLEFRDPLSLSTACWGLYHQTGNPEFLKGVTEIK